MMPKGMSRKLDTFAVKLILNLTNQRLGTSKLPNIRDHGQQNSYRSERRHAQDGPNLIAKNLRVLEAKSDRTATQEWVRLRAADGFVMKLIRSGIERADDEVTPLEIFNSLAITPVVPLFVGSLLVGVEKLRTVKPDPGSAPFECGMDLVRKFDVGRDADPIAIEGLGWQTNLGLESSVKVLGN